MNGFIFSGISQKSLQVLKSGTLAELENGSSNILQFRIYANKNSMYAA